jgi:hypothetical protein
MRVNSLSDLYPSRWVSILLPKTIQISRPFEACGEAFICRKTSRYRYRNQIIICSSSWLSSFELEAPKSLPKRLMLQVRPSVSTALEVPEPCRPIWRQIVSTRQRFSSDSSWDFELEQSSAHVSLQDRPDSSISSRMGPTSESKEFRSLRSAFKKTKSDEVIFSMA